LIAVYFDAVGQQEEYPTCKKPAAAIPNIFIIKSY